MRILWGIVQNYLLLPPPLRIIITLILILAILLFMWRFIKFIPIIALVLLSILNKLMTMISRRFICIIGKKSPNVYNWDEKLGRLGKTIDGRLSTGIEWLKNSTWHQILNKKCVCILVIIYLLAILPSLPLKNVINEYYLEHMYGINKIFVHIDKILGEQADGHPPLIDWPKSTDGSKDTVYQEEPQPEAEERQINLQLNQSTYYANVRESPERSGAEVCIVGREDTLVYQNEYSHDQERYWLKVLVESQNNLEGWISSNLIDNSIISELNLY